MASTSATNPETIVTLKVNYEGTNRRFKLPLRDLGASTLPDHLRFLLSIPPTSEAVFERYSDSAATFVTLDPTNTSVYKQLYRAAKAKLKLRIRVTVKDKAPVVPKPATVEDEQPSPVSPVEEQPELRSVLEEVVVPTATVSPVKTPAEKTMYPGSVSDLQRGFEELLINHPRFTTPSAPAPAAAPTPPVVRPSGCTRPNKDMPGAFHSYHPCLAKVNSTDIPVTRGPAARDEWFAGYSRLSPDRQSAFWKNAMTETASPTVSVYSVYCNNCNDSIPDVHYHCSICDDGDFDLCQSCVGRGVVCGSESHWLIKRFVQNGKVINSTTETIAPKRLSSESKTTLVAPEPKIPAATRTCNNCISELTEDQFVACTSCPDFDLCIPCHVGNDHGHHPKHAFEAAVEDASLDLVSQALLAPGRNVGHNAICDGCDKYIYGVRHKCLDCPDWDFCSACIANAPFIHPEHRFVPIYETLLDAATIFKSSQAKARHHGIYCDGPLCNTVNGPQTYIKGDRYKCAVCHDTDYCAACEASPANRHNKTHPLIKFKTPVRNVSVTTMGDHENGQPMPPMGDRRSRTTTKSTETNTSSSANAATQVQTVADLQPTETVKAEEIKVEKAPEVKAEPKELPAVLKKDYVAHFVRDVVADGTYFPANTVFEQTWYLRNGGEVAWPAGCSVKFVGGDNMCAVDPEHPASVHELVSAAESTVCYTEVAPGQEAGFTVLMRTPARAGNFISYWRLTGPDGDKFGHRLWCDVNVKETPIVKEETKEVVAPKVEVEGSQMIFPKLEKESPEASIHHEVSAPPSEVKEDADDFDDFADELEDEETEDGFMTDEEYDILDASDEEYLAEQTKTSKK